MADYESGLLVIDISNSTNPTIVGTYDTPGKAYDVYVADSYAYVADYSSLQIIDVSDPEDPILAGAYNINYPACVYIEGSYAYVAAGTSGLVIIDISSPATPSLVGTYYTIGNKAIGIYVADSYAYIADDRHGLDIIDISDLANPKLVATGNTPYNSSNIDIYVADDYIYVTCSSGLEIIDKFSPLTNVIYDDSGTISATVPAGFRSGTYNLHLTTPDGGYAFLRNSFTVLDQPTLIELDQFVAVPQNNQFILTWTTLSEFDNAGFNLWRSETANGEYSKINLSMIESMGGPTISAEYKYPDYTARDGVTYYYQLEDIDNYSTCTFHGPVSATIPITKTTKNCSSPYLSYDTNVLWWQRWIDYCNQSWFFYLQ